MLKLKLKLKKKQKTWNVEFKKNSIHATRKIIQIKKSAVQSVHSFTGGVFGDDAERKAERSNWVWSFCSCLAGAICLQQILHSIIKAFRPIFKTLHPFTSFSPFALTNGYLRIPLSRNPAKEILFGIGEE